MNNERGQGVIEFFAYITMLISFTSLLLGVFYLLYTKTLINYELQKTALCFEKLNASPTKCLKKTKTTLSKNLWFHVNKKIWANQKNHVTEVHFNSDLAGQKSSFVKKIEFVQ